MAVLSSRTRRYARYGLSAAGALGFLIVLAWLSWAMAFEFPRIPDRQIGAYEEEFYVPPPACFPKALDAIGDPAVKQRVEDACTADARRHEVEFETLRQAYRSTDAAEENVRLVFQQTRIAFFQAFFSVFALVFTGWAAWAATRASRAAEKATAHAEEVMRNDLRAYVHVDRAEVTWGADGRRPVITLFAKNTGQTPARWFGASAKVLSTPDDDSTGLDLDAMAFSDRPLIQWSALSGQGGELSFYGMKDADYPELRDIYENDKILNVIGRVRYETLFGEIYETEFWFMRRPRHRARFERPEGSAPGVAIYQTGREIPLALQRAPIALASYRLVSEEVLKGAA